MQKCFPQCPYLKIPNSSAVSKKKYYKGLFSVPYLSPCTCVRCCQREIIYTESKLLGSLCKMCNLSFMSSQYCSSVFKCITVKIIFCTAIKYTIDTKDWRVVLWRRLDQHKKIGSRHLVSWRFSGSGKDDLKAYALCFLILFECWQLFAKVLRAATAIDREGGRGREKQKLILNIKFIALTLLFQTPHYRLFCIWVLLICRLDIFVYVYRKFRTK